MGYVHENVKNAELGIFSEMPSTIKGVLGATEPKAALGDCLTNLKLKGRLAGRWKKFLARNHLNWV
jgi:hypothetical protein